MARFLVEFLIFFAILALSTLPAKYVASIVKRRFSVMKWMRGTAITALVVAGLGWSSRDLQAGCMAERNNGCIDFGGAGSQALVLSGFVLFALSSAYLMYRD